jgi:enoyl-CoA hydratase
VTAWKGDPVLNIDDRDGVLLIEMAHGKVNALDLELLGALLDAFGTAGSDRPIVLTGAGRAFSAGVDLRRITDGGPGYAREFLATLSECFLTVFDHPAPVVAAINGAAIAGGCVIAAACDHRLMSGGTIGLAELAVGVPFPTSAIEIMRSLLGPRTQRLVLTAVTLDPAQALDVGLVDEVVPADSLLSLGIERARTLAALPPGVFTFTKRQLHGPARERIAVRATEDDAIMQQLWSSDPVRDAVAEYLDKLGRR